MAEAAQVWSWQSPRVATPEHMHARREGAEVVLIITGSAGGALPTRRAGIRLPAAEALELARWILAGEPGA